MPTDIRDAAPNGDTSHDLKPHTTDLSTSELSPLRRAIRARALDTIQFEQGQPKPTLQRKLMTGLLVLLTVLLLVVAIDFGVRIIHRVLLLWHPESDSSQSQPKQNLTPGQPYFIAVDPPAEPATSNKSESSSSKSP